MNISAIGVASAAQGPDSADWKQRAQTAMAPVANLLGVSTDQLQQQLQNGQTLSGLAGAKGVSQSDLVSAIQQGLQAAAPAGQTPPAGLAQKIADGTVKHHHRHHHAASSTSTDPAQTTDPTQAGTTDPTDPFADVANGSSSVDTLA